MVNNQSLDGQDSPDVSEVGDTGLLGKPDPFIISVIVVASILFLVIVAIVSVMISSIRKKAPTVEKRSKKYAPGSAKRHYLASPENKTYLLKKYKCIPIRRLDEKTVPARNINPIYDCNSNTSVLDPTPVKHNDKALLVAANGGSPVDGLAVPMDTLASHSITSDLVAELKDFQQMHKVDKSPL
ncbi:uncharacterized protein LOC135483675 [Lineus longissimus]|uniref:uncharacterized protein LOC135483675 n=1 Tax=Lineus longissimus TaxID=88925 RepID=UPI002B4E5826